MRANKRMLRRLTTLSNAPKSKGRLDASLLLEDVVSRVRLAGRLCQLIESPIVEYESGIFLKALLHDPEKSVKSRCGDLTAWESFANHIHIGDYLNKPRQDDVLLQGLKYATELAKKLEAYKAGPRAFRVILGFADRDCHVRFHRYRPPEGDWLRPDLDGYDSAICVLETGRRPRNKGLTSVLNARSER